MSIDKQAITTTVRFKDLSMPNKIGLIGGWLNIIMMAIAFLAGLGGF